MSQLTLLPEYRTEGKPLIGVDEVGLSSLAGPMVFAAVWHENPQRLQHLGARDSKGTHPPQRARFAKLVQAEIEAGRCQVRYGVELPEAINRDGARLAEFRGLRGCYEKLRIQMKLDPKDLTLVIDGFRRFGDLDDLKDCHYIPKGDRYVPEVAAASMLARHTFDLLTAEAAETYPGWDFDTPAGPFITLTHLERLYHLGPTPFHKRAVCEATITTYCMKRSLPLPAWVDPDVAIRQQRKKQKAWARRGLVA